MISDTLNKMTMVCEHQISNKQKSGSVLTWWTVSIRKQATKELTNHSELQLLPHMAN